MFGRGSEIAKTGYEGRLRALLKWYPPQRRDRRFDKAEIGRAHLVDEGEDGVGQRHGERRVIGIGIEQGDEIVSRVGMARDQLEHPSEPDEPGVAQPSGQKRACARRAVKSQAALHSADHFARRKP